MTAVVPTARLDGMLEAFSIRVEALEGGVRLRMPRTEVTVGGVRNSIHGGVLAALVELAGHLALAASLQDGTRLERTQEVSLSYLSAARGEETVALGQVLRAGGRLAVVAVEVRDGGDGRLNASGRVTCVLARDEGEGS